MKKVLVAAAILIAIVLLAAPLVLGMLTEARVRERVAAIDEGDLFSAEVLTYDRGWFGATATVDLGTDEQYVLPDPATGAPPSHMVIRVDFAHGPITVLDGVALGLSKMVARPDPTAPGIGELQQQLAIPHLFEFRARTGFDGVLHFDADVPPIDFPVDEARLVFSGAFVEGRLLNRRLVADARIGAAEFTSPTGTFAIDNVLASTNVDVRSAHAVIGTGDMSIGSVRIVDALNPTAPVLEATNLRFTGENTTDASGALMDSLATYALERVRIQDSELTAATMRMVMRNLDIAALEAYSDAVQDFATNNPGDEPSALLAAVTPQIERALAAGPSLTIDPLRFSFDGEPFEASLSIAANAARLPPAGALTFDNPLLVLGFINSDANIDISKPLALRLASLAAQMQFATDPTLGPDEREYMTEAQAGLMLTMLMGQGVLIDAGDRYRSAVSLVDGVLTLNGNPLPLGLTP